MKAFSHTLISAAAVVALGLSGCGTSESTISANNDVTVERGPVLGALVVDANTQRATDRGNGVYRFATPPVYPIKAMGGYIDVNRNGIVDAGEVENTLIMQADEGDAVTLVSTLASNPELETFLISELNVTREQISSMTPGNDDVIEAISDEVYRYCIENNISDPLRISLQEMQEHRARYEERIERYSHDEYEAHEHEHELIVELSTYGLIDRIDDDEVEACNDAIEHHSRNDFNATELLAMLPVTALSDAQTLRMQYLYRLQEIERSLYAADGNLSDMAAAKADDIAAMEAILNHYGIALPAEDTDFSSVVSTALPLDVETVQPSVTAQTPEAMCYLFEESYHDPVERLIDTLPEAVEFAYELMVHENDDYCRYDDDSHDDGYDDESNDDHADGGYDDHHDEHDSYDDHSNDSNDDNGTGTFS